MEGAILLSYEILKTNEAVRRAVSASIQANPASKAKFIIIAPEFDGLLAEEKIKELLGASIFEETSRLRLFSKDQLGLNTTETSAYSRAVDHFRIKFDPDQNKELIPQIAMIAPENILTRLRGQKVVKLLESPSSVEAAELLIALNGGFDYKKLAGEDGYIDPTAEFMESLLVHFYSQAYVAKAA